MQDLAYRRTLVAVLLLSCLAAPTAAREVPFAADALLTASDVRNAEGTDLDGDGDLDLLLPGWGAVRWLEYDRAAGGVWVEHELAGFAGEFVPWAMPGDLDRDGDLDVVVFRREWEADMHLDWLENDGTPGNGGWVQHGIEAWSTSPILFIDNLAPGGVALGDVDGDGDLDVAAVLTEFDYRLTYTAIQGHVKWYANDGSPANGGWSGHVIQDWWDDHQPAGAVLADLDGDEDLDLVTGMAYVSGGDGLRWYENDGSPAVGTWTRRAFATGVTYEIPADDLTWRPAVGDPDRDGDLDVLYVTAGGYDNWLYVIVYVNDGTPASGDWPAIPVGSSLGSAGNHGRFADPDVDGWPDIVVGDPPRWYENPRGAGAWTVREVDSASGRQVDLVADLDGDGDPDLAAVLYSVLSYENLTIHRSARLRDERGVATLVDEAFDVAAGDLDGDGDPDLVSAAEANDHVYWHRNDGTPGDDTSWNLSTLTSAVDGPRAVALGDLDGDGDLDVVVASYNDDGVSWLENDGTLANWTKRAISSGAGGASDVALADFDRDGDLDVACAQFLDGEISWYRNNGGAPPTFSAFFVDSIAYAGPRALAAGDLDGDGDLDLAAVSETGAAVVWYANDGTPADAEWSRHRTDNGDAGGPKEVALADLDRDGDLDTLVASYAADAVAWYENDGSFAGWTRRGIQVACGGARGVTTGDFDGDGDLDVLLSCFDDDALWLARSNGAALPGFTSDLVTVAANGARAVVAADLDRDGDLDGAAAQGTDDQIAWYENRGGPFRVAGTAVAVDPLTNDAVQGIFRAVVTHRGRAGDGQIELAAVAVRLEEVPGDPLNAIQAVSLIDQVRLYGDDGDNVFEPGVDPLVAAASPAGIDLYGDVWVDVADGAAAAAISAVAQKTFFVALALAAPLQAAAPGTLAVTLLTDGDARCEAEDRAHDLPLDLEWRANAATATLAVLDVLFRDGFETGNTSRWSAVAP